MGPHHPHKALHPICADGAEGRCPTRAAPTTREHNHALAYRHRGGTWQLTGSLRAGVVQIAEFGFNLFAHEYPSPEVGEGGARNLFLIIWGIVYKAL